MHAIVDRVDACENRTDIRFRPEGKAQHRIERTPKAADPPAGFTAECAVIGDPLRHEGVGKLKQDRWTPSKQQDDLALNLPADGVDAGWRIPVVPSGDPGRDTNHA